MRELLGKLYPTAHRGPAKRAPQSGRRNGSCLDDDDLSQPGCTFGEATLRLENADVVYTWLSISDEKLGRIDATDGERKGGSRAA